MTTQKQIQEMSGTSNDLLQWQEVSPPSDVNAQVEDYVPDPTEAGPTPE